MAGNVVGGDEGVIKQTRTRFNITHVVGMERL